jgi:hypothetical protein
MRHEQIEQMWRMRCGHLLGQQVTQRAAQMKYPAFGIKVQL